MDTNTMQVKFTPQDPSTTGFEVTLKRINTHYSPDEHFLLGIYPCYLKMLVSEFNQES